MRRPAQRYGLLIARMDSPRRTRPAQPKAWARAWHVAVATEIIGQTGIEVCEQVFIERPTDNKWRDLRSREISMNQPIWMGGFITESEKCHVIQTCEYSVDEPLVMVV